MIGRSIPLGVWELVPSCEILLAFDSVEELGGLLADFLFLLEFVVEVLLVSS